MSRTAKRISILFLVFSILMSANLFVFAGNVDNIIDSGGTGIVTPMSSICTNCDRGTMVLTNVDYGDWYQAGMTVCTTHYSCVIKNMRRSVQYTYTCTYCGYSYTVTQYEDKYEHVPV